MAKDLDSVVRLQLKQLNNPQKAFALVRKTRSAEGANLVAKFCMDSGDHPVAIEFLLMARLQVRDAGVRDVVKFQGLWSMID